MASNDALLLLLNQPFYTKEHFDPILPVKPISASGPVSPPEAPQFIPSPGKVILPDLKKVSKEEHFSVFIEKHAQLAADLIDFFMQVGTPQELASLASHYFYIGNELLVHYALSVATLHRKDTSNVRLPSPMAVMPRNFLTAHDWQNVYYNFKSKTPRTDIVDLSVDFTGTDLEDEHKLAYFREDPGVSIHHYHWHIVYPVVPATKIKKQDRRGELFYYMHQQLVARYNFERLCNGLNITARLLDWYVPIPEGYFPRLPHTSQGTLWMSRQANTYLTSLSHAHENIDLLQLQQWRDRIYEAIHGKCVIDSNGKTIPLTPENGINILGCLVESNTDSVNQLLYGSLHNKGHVIISAAHDPDGRFTSFVSEDKIETKLGVLADTATAARDPVFYRWHAFIDGIFQEYKRNLDPYKGEELNFPGVKVTSAEIESEGSSKKNVFTTFWEKSVIDIEQGIDFAPIEGAKKVRFQHLQHQNFNYLIQASTASPSPVRGTARIFLAPKYDKSWRPMSWDVHRTLFIELDRFEVVLNGKESKVIKRASNESVVTAPFNQQFRPKSTMGQGHEAYCSCGWPEHLLIPKGKTEGMECLLFVMISNDVANEEKEKEEHQSCKQATSYCGVFNEKYPDKRAMGFPFDRKIDADVGNVYELVSKYDNMALTDVTVQFTGSSKEH